MNWVLNTSHGWGISARAHVQTALLYLRNGLADWVQFWCVSCTFARASPVSLSLKPFSLDIEATPKTDLSLSVSLVHRQTWRLTGIICELLA